MLMNYHQCSIMLVQLQEYIIANIQVYVTIILMYVYNIYLGISSPPQFPDDMCSRLVMARHTWWQHKVECRRSGWAGKLPQHTEHLHTPMHDISDGSRTPEYRPEMPCSPGKGTKLRKDGAGAPLRWVRYMQGC